MSVPLSAPPESRSENNSTVTELYPNADKVEFIDLRAQQRLIRGRVEQRLLSVLDHGRYINGPEINELEEVLTKRVGANAVACASGTDALMIGLLASGVGPGDAVFLPAMTYNATANAVLLLGATPVFVDIDPDTFNLDPADLSERISDVVSKGVLTPKMIIPVDLFGLPADYKSIKTVAAEYNLIVMADAAQGFGGTQDGVEACGLAPISATSFFPGKSLGAYGDAGAVFAKDDALADTFHSIRWHGTDASRKISERVGFNGRMDSFQAAVLLEKLSIFDDELIARRRVDAIYRDRLKHTCRFQRVAEGTSSGCGYFSVRVRGRDRVADELKSAGIPTAIYYATPLHRMPAFAHLAPKEGLPNTDAVANEIISLPMHPYLTDLHVDRVCDAVLDTASTY
ncbi:MAG: DegT/DnrJ/EryC1/StrS family aminotransferase [Pseudomonadota bacterium]